MARPISLLTMRTRVRQLTDTVGDGHVTDAYINAALNHRLAELWDLLVGQDPSRYRVTATTNTTAGTYEYTLPDDFHSQIALDYVRGQERWPVEQYNFEERTFGNNSWVTTWGVPAVRYEIAGQGVDGASAMLRFDGNPGTNTYELHYVQAPQTLAADNDTFDGVAGWEEWAVRGACIDVCGRQDMDPSIHVMEREKLEKRIRVYASKRDQHRPGQVQDVMRRRHSYYGV